MLMNIEIVSHQIIHNAKLCALENGAHEFYQMRKHFKRQTTTFYFSRTLSHEREKSFVLQYINTYMHAFVFVCKNMSE